MGKGHGDGLYVNYGSLEAVADDIKRQADRLKEDLGDIQSAVSKVASVWEGDAKTAYHEV
ncbi:MAG: WXG100 family type VII secretion target, partial [Micromonosporaceae bacterium]